MPSSPREVRQRLRSGGWEIPTWIKVGPGDGLFVLHR